MEERNALLQVCHIRLVCSLHYDLRAVLSLVCQFYVESFIEAAALVMLEIALWIDQISSVLFFINSSIGFYEEGNTDF